jgi:dimethylargininase
LLTYREREPIDVGLAREQHSVYVDCLRELGAEVAMLPELPQLPDAVFVEDTAVVFDEVAVMARPGAEARRQEVESVADALSRYRPLECIRPPATLDGGDVVTADRTVLVGRTTRTNDAGIEQLREVLSPFGYEVRAVPVTGCLHLKSACTYVGGGTLLVNCARLDVSALDGYQLLHVPESEPDAADTLTLNETVVMAGGFPETEALLHKAGRSIRTVDVGEFQKAEAAVSCLSLVVGA